MPKSLRFGLTVIPAAVLRFALGPHTFSFLWFLVLYMPTMNWTVYWIMFSVRVGINKLSGRDRISVPAVRRFFVGYLYVPGALVVAELIYQGYLYNR